MSHNLPTDGPDDNKPGQPLYTPIKRRSFFMYAGATAGATALILSGCKDDDETITPDSNGIDLGSGDVGVLNYAYALEQLEAAFYAAVVATPATDFLTNELSYFQEVAKHEAIHRDFFKAAISRDYPGKLLQNLTPDFSSVTFTQRASVLTTAKTFEDLGVAAYNGAGKLLRNPAYLVIAGQIVSVEARHAAFIRDLISPGSFAADDQVDPATGLDKAMTPVQVIAAAQGFIKEKLNASNVGVN
jgi:hypothetical protein